MVYIVHIKIMKGYIIALCGNNVFLYNRIRNEFSFFILLICSL